MVTVLSLDSVLRWSYCSMMYHLRDILGLPSFAPTAQTSWHFMMRSAVRSYFNSEIKSNNRGMSLATSHLENWARVAQVKFLSKAGHKMLRYLRGEALLTLSTIGKIYDRRRDTIIDTMIPYSYRFDIGSEQYEIQDRIDVLYFYNDKVHAKKMARAVLLTHTGDPILDAPKFRSVRPGMLRNFLKKDLGIPNHIPLEVVYVPCRGDISIIPISKQCEDEADLFFREVVPHLSLKIPVGQDDKCEHCPYEKICNLKLVGQTDKAALAEAVIANAASGMFLDPGV